SHVRPTGCRIRSIPEPTTTATPRATIPRTYALTYRVCFSICSTTICYRPLTDRPREPERQSAEQRHDVHQRACDLHVADWLRRHLRGMLELGGDTLPRHDEANLFCCVSAVGRRPGSRGERAGPVAAQAAGAGDADARARA